MPLLGESVEASRAQRIERQQARYRDRGGIFKPSEHNPLLDLLLARGVNGESPSRLNSPRRCSTSPIRKQPDFKAPQNDSRRNQDTSTPPQRVNAKGKVKAQNGSKEAGGLEEVLTVAGSSKGSTLHKRNSIKSTNFKKQTLPQLGASTPTESTPFMSVPPKAKNATVQSKGNKTLNSITDGAAPKPRRTTKRKAPFPDPKPELPPDEDIPSDDRPLAPAARKKVKREITTKLSVPVEDGDHAVPKPAKSSRRRAKKGNSERAVHLEESDDIPLSMSSKLMKGKRKAPADDMDAMPEDNAGSSGSKRTVMRTKQKPEAVGPPPARKGDIEASDTEVPLAASRTATGRKKRKDPPPSNVNTLDTGSRTTPNYQHRKPPIPKDDTPDHKSPQPDGNQTRSMGDEDAVPLQEIVPRRPKQLPLEDDSARISARSLDDEQAKRKQGDAQARKVSRTKAAPIPVPKGVKLKPKPRPRLSMFQPPPPNDESDRDPIDFLS